MMVPIFVQPNGTIMDVILPSNCLLCTCKRFYVQQVTEGDDVPNDFFSLPLHPPKLIPIFLDGKRVVSTEPKSAIQDKSLYIYPEELEQPSSSTYTIYTWKKSSANAAPEDFAPKGRKCDIAPKFTINTHVGQHNVKRNRWSQSARKFQSLYGCDSYHSC